MWIRICLSPIPSQQDGTSCRGGEDGSVTATVEGLNVPHGEAACYATQENNLDTCLGGSKDSCTWVFQTPGCPTPAPTPKPTRRNRKKKFYHPANYRPNSRRPAYNRPSTRS